MTVNDEASEYFLPDDALDKFSKLDLLGGTEMLRESTNKNQLNYLSLPNTETGRIDNSQAEEYVNQHYNGEK